MEHEPIEYWLKQYALLFDFVNEHDPWLLSRFLTWREGQPGESLTGILQHELNLTTRKVSE